MKLYKYYPPENRPFILLPNGNISLRFSQPSALNDPFDLIQAIDLSQIDFNAQVRSIQEAMNSQSEYFVEGSTGEYFLKRNTKEFSQSLELSSMKKEALKLKKNIDNNYGVLSLTRETNNKLMWSHYSNGHKGFLIEIENEFIIGSEKISFHAEDVRYENERPKIKTKPSIKIDADYFYYKDPIWKYENEMRLVVHLSRLKPTEKSKTNSLPCFCHSYPREKIGQIVIGALCPLEDETEIRKWAIDHKPEIQVKKAYIDPTHYDLVYKAHP